MTIKLANVFGLAYRGLAPRGLPRLGAPGLRFLAAQPSRSIFPADAQEPPKPKPRLRPGFLLRLAVDRHRPTKEQRYEAYKGLQTVGIVVGGISLVSMALDFKRAQKEQARAGKLVASTSPVSSLSLLPPAASVASSASAPGTVVVPSAHHSKERPAPQHRPK